MSILSTNKKIIKVQGTEYSAGEGIIIEDNVISVDMSAVSPSFSAGPNIDIYKQDEQSYISGRDWTDLIKEASANAYDSATGAIPEPQDLTYMSGAINYVSGEVSNASSYSYSQATGYYNTWITGQYEGDITNITNNISSISSSLADDYYKKTETSSKGEIDDALQYISANAGKTYEGISPIVVNNTEDKISAVTWVLSGGNNVTLVDDDINKVTRIDVEVPTPFDPTYMSAQIDNKLDTTAFSNVSGTFLTAHQTIPSAKWETASDVVQSNSAQWSENTGDEEVNNAVYNNSAKWNEISVYESNSSTYLTAHQSLDGYATQDWVTEQGYITGVDLSDYAKTSAVHNDIDSAVSGKLDTTAFSDVSGNFLTAHQDISYKLDSSAFSDVSGTFLTAINIPESANWNETTNVVQSNSATWNEISAVSGSYWPLSSSFTAKNAKVDINGLVNQHLVLNGAYPNIKGYVNGQPYWNWEINSTHVSGHNWEYGASEYNKLNSSYEVLSSNSGTWNDVSTTVQTNSAQWSDNTGDEEVNEFVYNNSATINDVDSVVQSNSAAWANEFDPSYMSGAIDNKLDESAFQETSGLFLTAIPQEYITESDIPNYISGKLDTTVFAGLSGDFLVASSLNGYATESFVENVSGDITALIPTDYATTTQVNELSGAIDYVSANAGDQEVHNIVHTNSATWDSVTNKLDTTAFSTVSGDFLTAINIPESAKWEDASDCVQTNSAQWAQGGVSPSGFVSGSNVLFVPNEYIPGQGKVYSANISGDITVNYGDYYNSGENINFYHTYSLSSVGSQIGDKLNKNVIEDSKTLSIIDDKAEVYSFAYRPSELVTTGITVYNYSSPNSVSIYTRTQDPYKLYSASLVIESDGFNYDMIPDKWVFVNSANGSATFSRFYKDQNYDNINFLGFWDYNLTNASAYSVAYSGIVIDALAFKSDLTGQGGNPEVESYVQSNSGMIDSTINSVQTNSSVWDNVTGKQDSLSFHYLEI